MIAGLSNDTVVYYDYNLCELKIYKFNYPDWNQIETINVESKPIQVNISLKQCRTCGAYGNKQNCEYCGNIRR